MSTTLFDMRPRVAGARSLLFVCLGNICRSPLARGVFEHQAAVRGVCDQLRIDSCGTGGWHVGEPADPRAVNAALRRSVPLEHVARQFDDAKDPRAFDLFLAMDRTNLRAMQRAGCPADKSFLFLAFADRAKAEPKDLSAIESLEVPDPYYGGDEGFEQVYRLVHLASEGLLDAMFAR